MKDFFSLLNQALFSFNTDQLEQLAEIVRSKIIVLDEDDSELQAALDFLKEVLENIEGMIAYKVMGTIHWDLSDVDKLITKELAAIMQ